MGSCLSKNETSEVSRRYLVDDSHFVALMVSTKMKGRTVKAFDRLEPPLCVWVSRGMSNDRPKLTDLSKRIVLESWVYLRPNMFKIGTILFSEMVSMSLAVRKKFQSYDVNIYNKSSDDGSKHKVTSKDRYYAGKSHVDKTMIALDKLISSLEDPDHFEYLIHELGDRHGEKSVRIEYLDMFMPCFIHAIRPALTEHWVSSIEDAWSTFLKHVIHLMKEAIVL